MPYQLLYRKTCHLPFKIEHRAYWALRSCNPDLKIIGEKQFLQLHELGELRLQAYKNSKLYKVRTKAYHDKKIRIRKEFKAGDKVLLYNSKYKFKAPKLRSNEEGKMEAISFMAPFPADYRETMPWVAEKPFIYSVVENTCNEATLYDLDETGEGMVKGNFLYVKKDPRSGSRFDTAYPRSWIRRIGDFLEHGYAVSSLMDTAYWSSK
ncbi:hypothetical protein Tco_1494120 [Tanacetum coccineum]